MATRTVRGRCLEIEFQIQDRKPPDILAVLVPFNFPPLAQLWVCWCCFRLHTRALTWIAFGSEMWVTSLSSAIERHESQSWRTP